MARIVKDPEERRRELLACAMRLFAEEGYDNVSVRAVARAAGVAPGLAYHYFDSKEKLFAAAIEGYAVQCAADINAALDEKGPSLDEKLDRAISIATDHAAFPHRGYFHAEGQGALHDRLSLAMCEAVRPHVAAALELDAASRGMVAHDADALASIMVYGCVGLSSGPGMPDRAAAQAARRYLHALLAEFRSAGADGGVSTD
ncbi:TetR/AcrR family transcriptional regulator [Collinsella ihumii]|uniref:TetR/AcrR family transcriptional regulator n=1 Tax=Collinsella ihumii TaxID=1720204 RepID=A0AAW7JT13_9ACTN|nr:TetR/AcrR family transcriptional regulator [Collinsella ihumii]MDN0070167.1 TetR/AcrR family transcriptional regulator [Collinsella ihumii]